MGNGTAQSDGGRLTRATVMFLDIVGFTALSERVGAERAYFATTGLLRLLESVARRHGGAVDKYLGDALLVVFGHPLPHADAPRAATEAALEMRRCVEDYRRELALEPGLDVVVGINTGELVAGTLGGAVVREFHVLGDTVNVAARLKSRARVGGIAVGPETEAATRAAFEYRALGTLALKGKAARVPTFELVSHAAGKRGNGNAADVDGAPFVGRAQELERLDAAIARLRAGQGGVVSLLGEEGSGKSRLLRELRRRGLLRELALFEASANGDGAGATLVELFPDSPPAEVHVRLEREAALAPVVVLVDDFQRLDPESLAVLEPCLTAAARQRVLFLLAARPDGAAAPARALGLVAREEIRLGPLAAGEARALLDLLAGPTGLPADARELVLERARGVPARLVLGAFVGPALRAEVEQQRADRSGEAERRRATILFADLTGFTAMTERLGAERTYPIAVECLGLLDAVARKHGGSVEKYLGDCVMALFGVPEAIEDAPRAAVNAAIEMRRAVREFAAQVGTGMPLDVHTGIHTGTGIAGEVSGALLREFAVMGDPVDVANELKDLAPAGTVWVGPETHRFTREAFDYRPLAPIPLPGHDDEVPVFELLSEREQLHRARAGAGRRVFSPLVGRERELEELRACLRRLQAGQGGIASVIGEAGLGKSRLLAELAKSPEAHDVAIYEGRSRSTGRRQRLHPLADLCRSWAGIGDSDDEAAARAKLVRAIEGALPRGESDEVVPFIASVVGLPPSEAERERLAGIGPDAFERLVRRSLTRLLVGVCERRPLVIVMDDVHWADESSVELIEGALRLAETNPVLYVNLFRPGYVDTSERLRAASAQRHADRHLEIRLRPLDAGATRGLLQNLFRPGDLPHALREAIEARARGNPFYVEEVVRALVDAGAAELVDGRFRATEKIDRFEIPGTVQEVIMARVDALPLRRRQLLQVASVIGASFHTDVLAGVAGEAPLEDDLAALLEAEFLVRSDRLPGRECAFKHPLIQEVTYEGLLETRREELHRQVGEAIAARLAADVPGFHGMLAFHFGKSRDLARAEEFLFQAAGEAARVAASSEALHFFQEASRLYLELHGERADPGKRATLEKNIAKALYFRGQFIDAVEHFNRALELLGERVPRGMLMLSLRFARNLPAVLLRLYFPRAGWRRPPASEREREVVSLMYDRAQAQVTASPARLLFDNMQTLATLQRLDPASVPGSGGMYAGAIFFAFGGISFGVSRRFLELAATLVQPDDPRERMRERGMNFVHHLLEGDWSPRHEVGGALIDENLARGELWEVTTYLGLAAEKKLYQGDFAGASAHLRRIDEIWETFQYDLAKTNHYGVRALLPLEQRHLDEALEGAQAYFEENPEDLLHLLALAAKAKAHLLRAELEPAEQALELARATLERAAPVPPYHASLYHLARLRFDVASLERATSNGAPRRLRSLRKRLRRSARAALASGAKVASRRVEGYRLAGRGRWLLGDRRGALRLFEKSVEEGERLGALPELARSYAELSRRLAEDGVSSTGLGGLDARECRRRAQDGFEKLDLRFDLARLEQGTWGD